MAPLSTLLLGLAASLASLVSAFDSASARSRSVYQVVTDRFALANGTSPACAVADRKYCGGSWAGLTGKLDYIQGMGFDTVWISPIVANIGGSNGDGEAYHGYWSLDISQLNGNFGTEQDLKDLISGLHSRGMYIMMDVVVNHVAATSGPTFQTSDSYGPFNTQSDFHPYCSIDNYNNQTNVEQCWLGDENVALPDLNTESQTVIDYFNGWVQGLVSNYSIDALRIDTVKHVRKDFWPGFISSGGVFAVGEVLNGDASYCAAYQNQSMDSIFNYPVYYPLVRAFNSTSGDISGLVTAINLNNQQFKDTTLLSNFLDNHDNARFENYTSDTALTMNAAAFPFVSDGIPYVYYGQEAGFSGGNDPYNREPMWTSNYNSDSTMYKYFAKLNAVRTAASNASSTYHTQQAKIVTSTSNEIVMYKAPVLSVLTNRGSSSGNSSMTINSPGFGNSVQLLEAISCTTTSTDSSGNLPVTISNGQPQIYIPVSNKGNLCSDSNTASTGSGSGKSAASATFQVSAAGAVLAGVLAASLAL